MESGNSLQDKRSKRRSRTPASAASYFLEYQCKRSNRSSAKIGAAVVKYLRESGRHIELMKEGYECGDSSKDWAVIVGRSDRADLDRHAPGARLFVVRGDLNLAQAGAAVSHFGEKGFVEDAERTTTLCQREEG